MPVYNPPSNFEEVVRALSQQTYPIAKLIIIDSSPVPASIDTSRLGYACEIMCIPSQQFDHGGTRNLGALKLEGLDFVLFLTHDAVMAGNCVEELVNFVHENALAGAFARQLPRPGAGFIESYEREFNYPPVPRVVHGVPGDINDVFFSNVCSIFRRGPFWELGGFPTRVITSEDMVFANALLKSGYKVGYCAEALVYHSHNFRIGALFRRYFDIGVTHAMWQQEVSTNKTNGRGFDFVKGAIAQLLRKNPQAILSFGLGVVTKFCGYNLGKRFKLLPTSLVQTFSANKAFWFTYRG